MAKKKKPLHQFATGRVNKEGKEFHAYNNRDQFLGWTNNEQEAIYMARNGYPNHMDDASELSLWLVWNDAVDSGEKVLEAPDGTQFLSLGHGIVMSAKEDESGYETRLLTDVELHQGYNSNQFCSVIQLTVAIKPLKLL